MKLRPVYQITTYTPPNELKTIKAAVSSAGGARYGNYADVYWTSAMGREQFTPLAGASPTAGALNETTELDSLELRFSIPRDEVLLAKVLSAIKESHPWEEPVIFVCECLASDSLDSN